MKYNCFNIIFNTAAFTCIYFAQIADLVVNWKYQFIIIIGEC